MTEDRKQIEFNRSESEYLSVLMSAIKTCDAFIGAQLMAEKVTGMKNGADEKGRSFMVVRDLIMKHMQEHQPRLQSISGQQLSMPDLKAGELLARLMRPANRGHFQVVLREYQTALMVQVDITKELESVTLKLDTEEKGKD